MVQRDIVEDKAAINRLNRECFSVSVMANMLV